MSFEYYFNMKYILSRINLDVLTLILIPQRCLRNESRLNAMKRTSRSVSFSERLWGLRTRSCRHFPGPLGLPV